jgi:hypothetical protein
VQRKWFFSRHGDNPSAELYNIGDRVRSVQRLETPHGYWHGKTAWDLETVRTSNQIARFRTKFSGGVEDMTERLVILDEDQYVMRCELLEAEKVRHVS